MGVLAGLAFKRRHVPIAICAWFGTAWPCGAQTQIENTRWISAPNAESSAQFMPAFAAMIAVSGRARISCEAVTEGPPQNCIAAAVAPEGMGFGEAGIRMAATGVVRPMHQDGKPVTSRFTFTATFVAEPIPETNKETIYPGPAPSGRALQLARRVVHDYQDQFLSQTWEDVIESLEPDRRRVVRVWLEELLPLDRDRAFSEAALAVARSVPLAELERYAKDGTPPSDPTPEAWEKAYMGLNGNDLNPKVRELRSRFCARWSCGTEFD